MLVLTRKVGESIRIGEDITVVVTRVSGNRVMIGIEAPVAVRVVRGELRPFVPAATGPGTGDAPPPASTVVQHGP